MKFIISGATGCIGFSLIKKLVREKQEVTVILNPNSARNVIIEAFSNVKIVYLALDSYAENLIEGTYDVFIHMAWSGGNSRDNYEINHRSEQYSVDAIHLANRLGCSKFISMGSQAEYGPTNEVLTETLVCNPNTAFGLAKLTTFHRSKLLCQELGINFTWVRILSAYGPNDRSTAMIMMLIRRASEGLPMELSSCTQKWDFLHADDIANAIVMIANSSNASNLYVVGSDEGRDLRYYVDLLASELNFDSSQYVNRVVGLGGQTIELTSNSSKIRNDLGWEPQIQFPDGARALIQSLLS